MAHDSDFVIARIRCPKWGQESDERLQVYLRYVDYGGEFRVGDAYAPDLDHLDVGYYVLRRPHAGEPLRVAVHTGCDACPYDFVWSRVILADGCHSIGRRRRARSRDRRIASRDRRQHPRSISRAGRR